MRAIDADALKIAIEDNDNFVGGSYDIIQVVNAQPTIQPEIVRCKECLYRKICSWEKQGAKFCSFAERREENNESN